MAVSGHNGRNETFVGNSSFIGLAFYDENSNEIQITQSNFPIDVKIKRDSSLTDSSFQYVNTSKMNSVLEEINSVFLLNTFNIKSINASIHIEIKPLNPSKSYLMFLKLGYMPILNSTYSDYDSFKIFCPSKKTLFYKRIYEL
jgi:hypothetical protein